jgi:YD repeat-containing protein
MAHEGGLRDHSADGVRCDRPAIESWIGTNDYYFAGGESRPSDNMVKSEILDYDGRQRQEERLRHERTLRVESTSTGERVTNYTYDLRGRLLLERVHAPPRLPQVRQHGRQIATALQLDRLDRLSVRTTRRPSQRTASR